MILKTGSGQGWRWRGAGGVVRLEDSIYFGQRDAGGGPTRRGAASRSSWPVRPARKT